MLVIICLWACAACGSEATTSPAAATTTPGSSRAYEIVLHRPLKAGDRFRVLVDASEQIEGSESSVDVQQTDVTAIDKDLRISLIGILTVREVDAEGRADSALFEVEEFKTLKTGATLLPAGAKIDAIRGAEEFTLMVDHEPRPDLLRPLRLAFPLHRPGSPLGDELFGSKQPRQIGDSWGFSKSRVAKSLVEDGYLVRETALTGDARLTGTTSVDGTECLEVSAKLHGDHAAATEQLGLAGVGNGKLDATIKIVVPIDSTLPLAVEEMTSQGKFEANVEGDSSHAERGVIVTRHRRAQYTRLSK